jgi:hypothetical protein
MPRDTSGLKRGGQKGRIGPNKATKSAREAIAAFVDQQTPRLNRLLEQIEQQDGPAAAFRCIMDTVEYHVPKLARTELTGKDGADLMPKVLTYKVEP